MPNSVCFSGFPPETSQTQIFKTVTKYGFLVSVTIPPDRRTLLPQGKVYVDYVDQKAVIRALQDSRKVVVNKKIIEIRRFTKRRR